MKKIIILLVLITSCNSADYIKGDVKSKVKSINYFVDVRTNICYAEIITEGNKRSFTAVDCNK